MLETCVLTHNSLLRCVMQSWKFSPCFQFKLRHEGVPLLCSSRPCSSEHFHEIRAISVECVLTLRGFAKGFQVAIGTDLVRCKKILGFEKVKALCPSFIGQRVVFPTQICRVRFYRCSCKTTIEDNCHHDCRILSLGTVYRMF